MPTIEDILKSRPIEDPLQRALLSVMYTGHWFSAKVNLLLKPFGLTSPQYNVLRILRGQKGQPISVSSIQERMVEPMSNVSRIIDKLVEKGVASRRICAANKRQVDVLITKPGIELIEQIEPAMVRQHAAMSQVLSAADATKLTGFLDALRDTDMDE